jgi:tetratricopeptide (TPR) repeat protein
MSSAIKSVGSALTVVLLLAGCAALAYARWTRPVDEADAALSDGDYPRALASYAAGESRFDRLPPVKQALSAEYNRIVANELWLLYRLERYDETIDKAERAPEGAQPHFWAGCAFFDKARAEDNTEARLGWLSRAEEEFRRAVEAAPDDWDTKFDFELTTRLAAELRKQPKTPPNQLMQLLRPEPKAGARPVKRVG